MIRYLGSRAVERPGGPSYDPRIRSTGPRRDRHPGVVGAGRAPRPPRRPRRARSPSWPGPGTRRTPRPRPAASAWILAVDWLPFQLPTFVTPAFAGFVSGHSTFSRAAAEVMTLITDSEFFPGGLGEWTVPAGSLLPELGPSEDVHIQAATYYDAADQAGISRLYGGIHIAADDFAGRRIGSECGIAAWALAQEHFSGTAS